MDKLNKKDMEIPIHLFYNNNSYAVNQTHAILLQHS